jgi:hypothetical protein
MLGRLFERFYIEYQRHLDFRSHTDCLLVRMNLCFPGKIVAVWFSRLDILGNHSLTGGISRVDHDFWPTIDQHHDLDHDTTRGALRS